MTTKAITIQVEPLGDDEGAAQWAARFNCEAETSDDLREITFYGKALDLDELIKDYATGDDELQAMRAEVVCPHLDGVTEFRSNSGDGTAQYDNFAFYCNVCNEEVPD